jgi:hypothetical protein
MTSTKRVDITKLQLDKIIRISSVTDINHIKCDDAQHITPIYNGVSKIIAIGDIHGDFQSLLTILLGAELIGNDLLWKGANTYIVFTGDLLDNFRAGGIEFSQHPADEITIISYLADLNEQAIHAGGRVILCLGNHELMNMVHPRHFGYVSLKTQSFFEKNLDLRENIFRYGSPLLQKLGCLFESFVLLNNKYYFCHAGITLHFIEKINERYTAPISFLEKLILFNNDVKNLIKGNLTNDDGWFTQFSNFANTQTYFWNRKYGKDFNKEICREFVEVSNRLGIQDLILIKGHDPQPEINSICDERIYRIDTEISRAFSAQPDILVSEHMNYLEINPTDNIFIKNKVINEINDVIIEKLTTLNLYKE